ncbi:MAG: hypothetical protein NC324_01065 [Bacteroides sp.]|nr:hypothetical protein [Bacteroides sp.]
MKRIIFIMALALACILGHAQNINPLNYSGRMYVEALEIFQTPRYVSYEDHAILSKQMRLPSSKVTKFEMDFEKGFVVIDTTKNAVKVKSAKNYDGDVVIYMILDGADGDVNAELVWPEYGKPHLQYFSKTDEGVLITRWILSSKPYIASDTEVLRDFLQGLGNL